MMSPTARRKPETDAKSGNAEPIKGYRQFMVKRQSMSRARKATAVGAGDEVRWFFGEYTPPAEKPACPEPGGTNIRPVARGTARRTPREPPARKIHAHAPPDVRNHDRSEYDRQSPGLRL